MSNEAMSNTNSAPPAPEKKSGSIKMNRPYLIKMLACFAVMIIFWVIPPLAPITSAGMKTIGIFIGTVLLLSLVDSTWPSILCVILFSLTGIMSLNEAIANSIGSWIITFVIMSFVLTHALNASGFTGRLTAFYMSRKAISRSPWVFTIAFAALGMMVGWFMDPVPASAFFLGFAKKICEELGYKKGDKYPQLLTLAVVFSINIGGGMTPISHPLAVLGMGIYEKVTGQTIGLFQYMAYGIPTGLIIFAVLMLVLRLLFKPDMSKFDDFDINRVVDKVSPMEIKEKITVFIFFATAFMWVLPGFLSMVAPTATITTSLNRFGITFWAILSVVLLAIIQVDEKPVIDLKEVWTKGFPWPLIFFIAAGILLGSAVTNEAVGFNEFITQNLMPITQNLPPILIVLIITFATSLMTNFTSNVTTIVLMTGVGLSIATNTVGLNPLAIALTTTMTGALAYMVPASFATIAMLHGDEYSNSGTIIKYGAISVVITTLIATFIGYPLATLIS